MYIYIYIYICVCVCVYIYARICIYVPPLNMFCECVLACCAAYCGHLARDFATGSLQDPV